MVVNCVNQLPSLDANKLSQFWQELKRRRVTRIITIYAAAAFVILELVDIIAEPLKFPEWFLPGIIVILCIGLIIAVILSWIYDIHPEGGIVKTEPARKVSESLAPPSSKGWKTASFISFLVIIVLILINVIPGRNESHIDPDLEKSIAILPILNFSGDPNQEYICDGLTDEIISHLYRIKSFEKVVSLTSVMNYKDSDLNISEIAEELGVNYILESTYKYLGDQLRITTQLIEPVNDKHIWLHDFDLPYEEIIAIPGDIAIQIADHLKAFISNNERNIIQELPTSSLEAYEILQKLRYYYGRSDFTLSYHDSILKAIDLDPEYSDAYAFLGYSALTGASYLSQLGGAETTLWDAMTSFDKALELDPDNLWANFFLGYLTSWVKWDYITAEKLFVHVLDAASTNEDFRDGYLEFLLKRNRLEEALSYGPDVTMANDHRVAQIYVKKGDHTEAKNQLGYYIDFMGVKGYPSVGEVYIWMNEYDTARYYLELASKEQVLEMYSPRFQACLALVYQKINASQMAQAIIGQLKAQSRELAPGSPDYFLGWYYSGIGEADSAFYYLERAYKNNSVEFPWLKADPVITNLKDDPRYWDLYERTGHKAYDDFMAGKQ